MLKEVGLSLKTIDVGHMLGYHRPPATPHCQPAFWPFEPPNIKKRGAAVWKGCSNAPSPNRPPLQTSFPAARPGGCVAVWTVHFATTAGQTLC